MTITKSGELASFYTINKAPIKHLRVYFSPKQAGSGDPSPENVRPIDGWNNINVTRSGKNMLDASIFVNPTYSVTYNDGVLTGTADNLYQASVAHGALVNNFNEKLHSTFSLSAYTEGNQTTSNSGLQPFFRYSNPFTNKVIYSYPNSTKNYIKKSLSLYNYDSTRIPAFFGFSYESGMNNIWHIKEFQWEMGDNATEYEPYKGQTYSLDWSNDIGTIYGGYVDLITGELVQTMQQYIFNGNNDEGWGYGGKYLNRYRYYSKAGQNGATPDMDYGEDKTSAVACNYLYIAPNGTSSNYSDYSDDIITVASLNRQIYVAVKNQTTVDEWTAYLAEHPLIVVSYLQNPITYQLTPQQFTTFIGRNNIWSNADRVEVEYDLAESNDILYRRRNVLERGYPHIVTPTSSGLVTFNTDMVAPLKECKIYFNPIQQGGGDPSPENIRSILPHTEFEINNAESVNILTPQSNTIWTQDDIKIEYLGDGLYHLYGNVTVANQSIPLSNIQLLESFIIPTSSNGGKLFLNNSATSYTIYLKYSNGNKIDSWDLSPINRKINSYSVMGNKEIGNFSITINSGSIGKRDLFFRPIFMKNLNSNITIPFPLGIDEIYGGYIDLVKGELVETCKRIQLSGQGGSWVWNCYTISIDNIDVADRNGNYNILACSHTSYKGYGSEPLYSSSDNIISISQGKQIRYRDNSKFTDLESARAYIQGQANAGTPVQVVAKLATPIVYTIDPITLKTLRGTNNIWSTANGNIELSYWTH